MNLILTVKKVKIIKHIKIRQMKESNFKFKLSRFLHVRLLNRNFIFNDFNLSASL